MVDSFLLALKHSLSFMIMLSYVYPTINTVRFIAVEKEKQLKEAMKIMGLPNWLHWTGWFVKSMTFLTISMSVVTVLFKVSSALFNLIVWSTVVNEHLFFRLRGLRELYPSSRIVIGRSYGYSSLFSVHRQHVSASCSAFSSQKQIPLQRWQA